MEESLVRHLAGTEIMQRITRKAQTCNFIRRKNGDEVKKLKGNTAFHEVMKESYRYDSIKGPSHVKGRCISNSINSLPCGLN
jgi:hypothetical protein